MGFRGSVLTSVREKSAPLNSSGSSVNFARAEKKQSPKFSPAGCRPWPKSRYAWRASSACSRLRWRPNWLACAGFFIEPFQAVKDLVRLRWRRGSGSNRRIKVLQTFALPLGYRADQWRYTCKIARRDHLSQTAPAAIRLRHRVLGQRPREKLRDIVLELGAGIAIDVEHVPGLVKVPDHIFMHVRIQAHVIERVLDGEVRCRQIEVQIGRAWCRERV